MRAFIRALYKNINKNRKINRNHAEERGDYENCNGK
jgi:hypothetical protein